VSTPPAAPKRRFARLRGAFAALLLLTISGGLTLLLCEVAIRLIAPQQLVVIRPDIWQPADSVGWLTRPNAHVAVNTGERTVSLITDSAGFRVGGRPAATDGLRVLLIGDSFMQALQVEHEQSVAALLEDTLSRALGQPVAVRNAGVDGWDPPQYLIRARTLLDRGRYDALVVTLFTGNDIVGREIPYLPPRQANATRRLRWPGSASWASFVDAVLYPINDWLDRKSHLFTFTKRRLETLRMRLGLSAEYFPTEFLKSSLDDARWEVTAGIVAAIHEAARSHGVPAVFVIIPTHYQTDGEAFARYALGLRIDTSAVDLEQPDRILREKLAARGLRVVDLLEPMRQSRTAGIRPYGSVDYHLSPEGHAVMSRAVAPVLAELLSATRPARRGRTSR